MRVQGWDPVLIICQIISLQTIHYLALSLVTPPLLAAFTSASRLEYSGGGSSVAHILDWREMAGRSTIPSASRGLDSGVLGGAWSGGRQVGVVEDSDSSGGGRSNGEGTDGAWDRGIDERRGWIMGFLWLAISALDGNTLWNPTLMNLSIAPLYYLIRRPTFILDFSLTLNLIHIILTTYYSRAFPTSLFFWVIQALGALLMITVAEQLCVKREMSSDLEVSSYEPLQHEEEGIPLQTR